MTESAKMEKLKMHSPDLRKDIVAKIAELFPHCVTESESPANGPLNLAIDFDALRQELSTSIVDGNRERYRIEWPGKREATQSSNAPIAKTLRPCVEKSVNFGSTKNLFIEGDNLDALKLLQESFLGKVKVIYIDPPYNTGNDFIYDDKFETSTEEYLIQSRQKDDLGNRMVVNTDTNGRFHSDWLSMIYPRLRLARNLLRDDGVIFISVDDVEIANLQKVCNEVFGEENRITQMIWEGAFKNDARHIGISHEYILVYCKSKICHKEKWTVEKTGTEPVLREVARLTKKYKTDFESASRDLAAWFRANKATESFAHRRFRHIDKIGAYKEDDPTAPGGRKFQLIDPRNGNKIRLRPNRGWGFDQEKFNRLVEEGRISFISDTSIMVRRYLHETGRMTPQSVFYQPARSASERLAKILGKSIFDFPKDESILELLIEMSSSSSEDSEDIVLDFFAGSATTAHAVMSLNAKQNRNRRFIMVQLPEPCAKNSKAFEAGFKNIADIGMQRIRRVGEMLSEELGLTKGQQDLGFRVFKIDSSNMKDVYYSPDAVSQDGLFDQVSNIKEDREPLDLLFQVLIDWGVDLSLPIAEETINDKTVFFVDENALAACFDTDIDEAFVKELAARKPLRAVFRDASYSGDSVKINVEQIFKLISPATELRSI